MKTNMNILKMFLLSTLVVLFTACGSSNTGDSKVDAAIDKIVAYAESGGQPPVPTLQDYIDAGVVGISDVDAINEVVATLTEDQVDTPEKIQKLANDLGVSLTLPIAKIDVTRTSDTEDPAIIFSESQSIRFSAEGSIDPDGSIVSYKWTEGSKTLFTIAVFDISTFSIGKHVITLTVTDNDGNTNSTDVTIRVAEAEAQTCLEEAGYGTVELSNGHIWLDRSIGASAVGEVGTLYTQEEAIGACPCGFSLTFLDDYAAIFFEDIDYSALNFANGGFYVPEDGGFIEDENYGYYWNNDFVALVTEDGLIMGPEGLPSEFGLQARCIDPATRILYED